MWELSTVYVLISSSVLGIPTHIVLDHSGYWLTTLEGRELRRRRNYEQSGDSKRLDVVALRLS